ncbi:serine hydrolase [Shewanella sp. WXL01]|uniref:serine hydrolase domain-containing protein n=1 Tax=Shewanella sp. WXL01 TaxID=2709721 RepID=UPI0014384CE8|nr:serine hydrolase [Shewanella sp. WXL01]NKF49317.1 serine hydrolase [Shewanella sp. WXL01]
MKKSLIAVALLTTLSVGMVEAASSIGKTRVEMGANASNILHPDVNRYTYKHLSEFVNTKQIDNGGYKQVIELPKSYKQLDLNMTFEHKGERLNLLDTLNKHRADAFVVLKNGEIVAEQYFDGQSERTHHQMMSVTKSFTGIIAATLVAEGKLNRDALVKTYIPELAQSAFSDATVGEVLDMTNNLKYSEAYEDPNAEVFKHAKTVGLTPKEPGYAGPQTIHEFLAELEKDGERDHGQEFHYLTANTDVVAWLISTVENKPFSEVLQERIWTKLGMERGAYIMSDPASVGLASGGLNGTARDMARFGQMLADGGKNLKGERVIHPRAVMETVKGGDPEKFAKGGYSEGALAGWSYKNQFWHTMNDNQAFTALGIFGQWIYVDPTENVVVVRQASSEKSVVDAYDHEMVSAINEIVKQLKMI